MLLRSIAILVTAATFSGGAYAGKEADEARDLLQQKLCSARTRNEVVDAAKNVKLSYFIDDVSLTAKRDFDQHKLVSSSVVVEVKFNADSTVASCRVRVLYTGP